MRSASSGFTLIEVLVALMLSGLVLALGQRILAVLLDGDAALARTAHAAAVSAEGLGRVRRLVARATRPLTEARPFVGTAEVAEFDSLCEAGRGGLRHCRVTLRTSPGLITLDAGGIHWTVLLPRGGPNRLQYQQRTSGGDSWADAWGTSLVLPSALRIVAPTDTLDLPVAVDR